MDSTKTDARTESMSQVSGSLWRQAVLTSCVLAGCLALIAVLVVF
jgi:hypothetical protein